MYVADGVLVRVCRIVVTVTDIQSSQHHIRDHRPAVTS
jgi:ribosomal protein S3AE